MSVQSVSPFSNFKTNNNTSKSTITNSQAVQNVAQEAGKINKKTAAIVGGLAALAFAGTVAAVAIKRHKAPYEIKIALDNLKATNETVNSLVQSVQKQADEITQYAKKVYGEVTELFEKGEEIAPDGTVLRKITGDDTSKIMEEFTQDGEITRKSFFVDNALANVREGIEELADGTKKTAKGIIFEDGKPCCYVEDLKELADGSWKTAKGIIFEDGTPYCYMEDLKELADGTKKIAKGIVFEDGKPSLYQEGYKELADGSEKFAKKISFKDGKLSEYAEDIEELADGSEKFAKGIDFKDGKPSLYQEGYKELPDDTREVAKEFKLTDKGWKKVGE